VKSCSWLFFYVFLGLEIIQFLLELSTVSCKRGVLFYYYYYYISNLTLWTPGIFYYTSRKVLVRILYTPCHFRRPKRSERSNFTNNLISERNCNFGLAPFVSLLVLKLSYSKMLGNLFARFPLHSVSTSDRTSSTQLNIRNCASKLRQTVRKLRARLWYFEIIPSQTAPQWSVWRHVCTINVHFNINLHFTGFSAENFNIKLVREARRREMSTKRILGAYTIKFLWPTLNSLYMFSKGTFCSQAHKMSVFCRILAIRTWAVEVK
jgi:hypothetical protein